MTINEYEKVICAVYCQRKGGDACKRCRFGPEAQNNFVFNPDIKQLIEIGVVADGKALLEEYVKTYHGDLIAAFDRPEE